MNNNDDRKPAPSVAPLDASQINGAFHLLDRDEMVRALEKHSAYTALFSTDAPTGPAITAIIERMHATIDAATAPATPTPPHGHITDADAARDAQDDQADAATNRQLLEARDEIAVLTEQRESLIRKNSELMARVGQLQAENVALLNARAPFVAQDSEHDVPDAWIGVLRARDLEAQGARCGFRPLRDADGQIAGIVVGVVTLGVGMVADIEPVGMAVTDGGDVAEWKEAA